MRAYPRISIITPSYNQAPFLEQTIRSVLDQGYPNLEYIVMDGGSTDGSAEIIREHAGRLADWASEPDGGQADAIRRGFERSTGEILGYVNSDDLLLPGSLEHIALQFSKHPGADFLTGGHVNIDEGNRVTWCTWPVAPTLERVLLVGFYFAQPACFWRRRAYVQVGGLDPSYQFCLDLDLFLRILDQFKAISTVRLLACFRSHSQSKSNRLGHVHLAEKSRIHERWNQAALLQKYGHREYLTWRTLMVLRRAPQLLKFYFRYGHLRPWLSRNMLPEECLG
jgi:glycosyltransferase involved in cell wall biosynthesis